MRSLARRACSAAIIAVLTAVIACVCMEAAYAGTKEVTAPRSADKYAAKVQEYLKKGGAQENPLKLDAVWDDDEYVGIYSPTSGQKVFYNSQYIEKLPIKVDTWDVYEDYYTCPVFVIFDSEVDNVVDLVSADDTGYANDWTTWTYSMSLVECEYAGQYVLGVFAAAAYEDGSLVENWTELEPPVALVNFYLTEIKAPKGLKATAGKKKVTITYKKTTGAQKYQIYRSTRKGSGYKKIATTKKTKYVDKKAKKGKRYYYKVRCIRSSGVNSNFCSPKRSGKVK